MGGELVSGALTGVSEGPAGNLQWERTQELFSCLMSRLSRTRKYSRLGKCSHWLLRKALGGSFTLNLAWKRVSWKALLKGALSHRSRSCGELARVPPPLSLSQLLGWLSPYLVDTGSLPSSILTHHGFVLLSCASSSLPSSGGKPQLSLESSCRFPLDPRA